MQVYRGSKACIYSLQVARQKVTGPVQCQLYICQMHMNQTWARQPKQNVQSSNFSNCNQADHSSCLLLLLLLLLSGTVLLLLGCSQAIHSQNPILPRLVMRRALRS